MQETQRKDVPDSIRRELFHGKDKAHLFRKMDNRLQELNEPLVSRKQLSDSAACPCGSGKIFKNCCKGKSFIPDRKTVSLEDVFEKLEQLERKIDLIFGGHVLLNGQFKKL